MLKMDGNGGMLRTVGDSRSEGVPGPVKALRSVVCGGVVLALITISM